MALHFRIFRSVNDLPAEWDASLHSEHPLHSTQVGISEICETANMEYYYVMTYFGERLVLCSYFQHLKLQVSHFNCQSRLPEWLGIQTIIQCLRPSLLVAGNLFRHDTFYVQPFSPYKEDESCEWYLDTVEEMMRLAKATGVFIKDLPEAQAAVMNRHPRFNAMQDDITMVFDIPSTWTDMNDYQKALKHKYAQRYKKTRKQAAELSVKALSLADIEQEQFTMEALYRQVSDHQMVSMGKINHRYFPAQAKALGEKYRVFAWYDAQGIMKAFSTAIVNNGIYDMNYIGFDYAANNQYALYFNILFHCMQQAIEGKHRRLMLGRTALEAKAILGCHPISMHGYYRLRHRVVRSMFKLISKQFNTQWGDTWQGRHPFKQHFYTEQGLDHKEETALISV